MHKILTKNVSKYCVYISLYLYISPVSRYSLLGISMYMAYSWQIKLSSLWNTKINENNENLEFSVV